MEDAITVGDFLNPQPSDRSLPTIAEARQAAREMASQDTNRAIAVWKGSDLVCVFLRCYELVPGPFEVG